MENLMKDYGWVGLGLMAALSAAGVTLFGSIGLEKVNPTLATTLRSVIMMLTLVMVSLFSGQLQTLWQGGSNMDLRAWVFVGLAGLSGAISWLAYFAALQLGVASKISALDRLSVAFIFVLSIFFLGERHSWQGWLGLGLLVSGVYLIAAD
jgi:transporter family protein